MEEPLEHEFPSFAEKILDGPASHISWSPTHDLAALVFDRKRIALCRCGIHLIWTLESPDHTDVTDLVWKPSGQELAFATKGGSVFLVDTRSFEPQVTTCFPPSAEWTDQDHSTEYAITSLAWIRYDMQTHTEKNYLPDIETVINAMPLLTSVPPDAPTTPIQLNPKPSKEPLPPKHEAPLKECLLLLVGDTNANVHVCFNGIYYLGHMSATADTSTGSKSKRQRTGHKSEARTAREEAASVVSVSTDANADILRVLLRRESSTDNAPSYTLKILSNPVLKNRKEEICNIAASQMQINYLLNYMGYCFRLLERHHRTVLSMANQNAEKITSSIINHDEEGTAMPELEMIGFLALGRACDAVEEYFSEKVSERQVRMWQSRTAHSYMTCRTIASAYLLPACDRLMVYLDYWKGCSMHIQKYAGLLSMDEVCQSIHSAKTLSKRLHSYLAEVTKASKLFDEFILWVIHTTQKYADKKETGRSEMEQPHLENEKPIFTNTPWPIIDYLNSYFASDGMAHFFDDPPDAPRTEASLRKMFNNLKDTCTKTMTQPAAIVTQNTTVIGSIDIPIRAAPQQPNTFGRDMVAWAPDEDLQMYAFTKRDPLDETLTLVRMAGADIIEGVQIDLSGIRIHDMEFFDQNNLGVVYSTAQDDDSSTIATMDLGSYAYSKLSSMKMAKNERAKPIFARTMELPRMANVVLGANGRPRRRILGMVASNSRALICLMDN